MGTDEAAALGSPTGRRPLAIGAADPVETRIEADGVTEKMRW